MATPFLPEIPEHFLRAENALFHVVPVPYDLTSTWRKGADKGPEAICLSSNAVEWYDIETASEPHLLGVHTLAPIEHKGSPDDLADIVQRVSAGVLTRGSVPIVLGGEHSVSIGPIRAAAAHFSDLTVLQIDAHADTRERYHGSPCNHACVMARAREVAKIVQVGIRSIDVEEVPGLDPARTFYAHDILDDASDAWMDRVCALLTPHTYITIDLDAFDPSIMPATGTPEPGGLTWRHVNRLVDRVSRSSRVVACDVVELCPRADLFACDFLAAKLVHRLMAMIGRDRA